LDDIGGVGGSLESTSPSPGQPLRCPNTLLNLLEVSDDVGGVLSVDWAGKVLLLVPGEGMTDIRVRKRLADERKLARLALLGERGQSSCTLFFVSPLKSSPLRPCTKSPESLGEGHLVTSPWLLVNDMNDVEL
jgi:hypothetical protein